MYQEITTIPSAAATISVTCATAISVLPWVLMISEIGLTHVPKRWVMVLLMENFHTACVFIIRILLRLLLIFLRCFISLRNLNRGIFLDNVRLNKNICGMVICKKTLCNPFESCGNKSLGLYVY